MAIKRIKKDQIDSGKKELPKKLAFLNEAGIDYSVIAHEEASDTWSVELPLLVIRTLARKAIELKDLKRTHKELERQAALVTELQKDKAQLLALREATASADTVMRKAVRRINAMEKLLGIAPGAKLPEVAAPNATAIAQPAQGPAVTRQPKAIKAIKAVKLPAATKAPTASDAAKTGTPKSAKKATKKTDGKTARASGASPMLAVAAPATTSLNATRVD